jgi:hypothetical protein
VILASVEVTPRQCSFDLIRLPSASGRALLIGNLANRTGPLCVRLCVSACVCRCMRVYVSNKDVYVHVCAGRHIFRPKNAISVTVYAYKPDINFEAMQFANSKSMDSDLQ